MNFYERMGILPLKKRVNRDKCSFTTKQRMFGVFAIDEILRYRWTWFVGSRTLCHPEYQRGQKKVFRPDFWGLLKGTKYLRQMKRIEMARDAITDDYEQGAKKGRDKAGISFRPWTSLKNHYMQLSEAAFPYYEWKIVHETKTNMFSVWCVAAHPWCKRSDLNLGRNNLWTTIDLYCKPRVVWRLLFLIWARLQDQIKNSCLVAWLKSLKPCFCFFAE